MTFQMVPIGALNQLASIQRFESSGVDENGQPVGSWVEAAQEYVHVAGLSGRILEIARQLFETASHNVYMRYNVNCTRSSRIVVGETIYAVGWVDVDSVMFMRATCEESWPGNAPR